jgi:integrase/recombinase XerD
MNLQQLIEQYIAFRRGLGERCKTNATILRAFGRAVGAQADITDVRTEQVHAFLAGAGPVTSGWHVRHTALKGLYRYALSRGYATASPLPVEVPRRPPPFVPYIYSRAELRRLLDAVEQVYHPLRCIEPITLRAMLLLLYGAGLRVSEAVRLDRGDIDLESSLATIRDSKFFKSRLVPLGAQLAGVLRDYAVWRQARHPAAEVRSPFFVTPTGARVQAWGLRVAFRRLCARAGVRRDDGARYPPRLHDLRHSFAVHRLTAWYRQGADVQKLLAQLSVYLGHRCLAATQVYLTMTPELLQQAGTRFEQYAGQEENDG